MVDKDLIRARLTYLDTNVGILESKSAIPKEDFLADTDQQYVVLHAMQLAIQAAIDLAAHIVTDEGWGVPVRSGQAFAILADNKVLTATLAAHLRSMSSFRNLIVHEYGALDLNIVYKLLHESLPDLRQFAGAIEAFLSESPDPQ